MIAREKRNYINIKLPHLDMCFTEGMSLKAHGALRSCHDAAISARKVEDITKLFIALGMILLTLVPIAVFRFLSSK